MLRQAEIEPSSGTTVAPFGSVTGHCRQAWDSEAAADRAAVANELTVVPTGGGAVGLPAGDAEVLAGLALAEPR